LSQEEDGAKGGGPEEVDGLDEEEFYDEDYDHLE